MSKEKILRPISDIFIIRRQLTDFLSDIKKQHKTFLKAKETPSSIDDELVSQMYKTIVKQQRSVRLYEDQVKQWSIEATRPSDKKEVETLKQMVHEIQELNKKLLDICDYIRDKTIESIMNMDDAELGLKTLMGDIPLPTNKK